MKKTVCFKWAAVHALTLMLATPVVAADNILIVILDDLGIEHVKDYDLRGPSGTYAPFDELQTNHFSSATENWAYFERAWSNPYCSPTRSTIQTGLYGHTTGTGWLIGYPDTHILDTDDDHLLAKKLQSVGYQTAALGKWHLGVDPDPSGLDTAPFLAGYDYFEGTLVRHNNPDVGLPADPWIDYQETIVTSDINSVTQRVCRDVSCAGYDPLAYITKDTVQAAIDWITTADTIGPWFAYVALNAPHQPWLCPPSDAYIGSAPACDDTDDDELDEYWAMLQVADEQIDRLLSISAIDNAFSGGDTYVFILSDNGTPGDDDVVLSPINPNRAKGTVFEGGVRIPFYVSGPGVVDGKLGESFLINVSDVYETVLDIAGFATNPRPEYWQRNQSQTFLPILDGSQNSERSCIHTEVFDPNGMPLPSTFNVYNRAVAGTSSNAPDPNHIYKYVEMLGGSQIGLYNLSADPWEATNLCAGASGCDATENAIIDDLKDCRDEFKEGCTGADLLESCEFVECCPGLACNGENICVDPI